jgi:hypothetical protein
MPNHVFLCCRVPDIDLSADECARVTGKPEVMSVVINYTHNDCWCNGDVTPTTLFLVAA